MTTRPRHIDINAQQLVDLAAGEPQILCDLRDGWSVALTSDTRTCDADYRLLLNIDAVHLTDAHLVDLIGGQQVVYTGPANQGYLIKLSTALPEAGEDL